MKKMISLLLVILGYCPMALCQADDDSTDDRSTDTAMAAPHPRLAKVFPATRVVNGSSVTNLPGGVLDFRISHRFGRLNEGSRNFFGLDNATTRVGLDYGITRWLMVGLGHSTLEKEDDGFLKLHLLNQKQGGSPIALSYFAGMSIQTTPAPTLSPGETWLYKYRLYYAHQLLVARQFGSWLSLQVMPTLVHYNITDSSKNQNNTVAIGVAGRMKLNKRLALVGEYFYRLNNRDMNYNAAPTYDALSAGLEIESGGHVFQLMLTNAQGITERSFVTQTTDRWRKGELHFGFNISRVFAIVKPHGYATE